MFNSFFGSLFGGFTNWKTTLASVVGFIALLLHAHYSAVNIDAAQQATIVAFIVLVVGWLAKDSTATGHPLDDNNG